MKGELKLFVVARFNAFIIIFHFFFDAQVSWRVESE